jgi:polyphenol oxidase
VHPLNEIDRVIAPCFGDLPHGFLGRAGGVSSGIFASLNVGLGSSDDRDSVQENRARAVATISPGAALVTLHQIHSAQAVSITTAVADAVRPQADGMATNQPGLALAVLTADCAPVLFADLNAGVIGAAHAGWKGALTGVLANTVSIMESLGAARHNIVAAIGPCIAQRSYEVDDSFRLRFEQHDPECERFFRSGVRALHHQFDLEGFVASQLARCGVSRVHACGEDTYAQADRYFSYRRTTHAGEPDYGRQISLIALP